MLFGTRQQTHVVFGCGCLVTPENTEYLTNIVLPNLDWQVSNKPKDTIEMVS